MSTKINVRSPFYLNLTAPPPPSPLFTCELANIKNLRIDQQGQISSPNLEFGQVLSITSADADFSNDQFATETVDTSRTLVVKIAIPSGFTNTSEGFINCSKVVIQPALVTGGATPTCTGGPTVNGSIAAQTINSGGVSVTIDLSAKYNAGSSAIAGYNIYNPNQSLVSATVNGNNLVITSNNIGGTTNIKVSAFDNDSNTCTATQSIGVTVNVSAAFICDDAALTGGSIAQNGTIVKPDSLATVGNIKASSGGATITSYPANGTGSDRSVTLFFDLTIPDGYTNSGTLECSKTFIQPSSLQTFICQIANLSGQKISADGVITKGSVQEGEITSFSPLDWATVLIDTPRTVAYSITIPSGYSNSGTLVCNLPLTQPAQTPICGTNTYYLSPPMSVPQNVCTDVFPVSKEIKSNAGSVTTGLGSFVCENDAPFNGNGFYYGIHTSKTSIGKGTGTFKLWQIDTNGIVQSVEVGDCPASGGDNIAKL